MAGKKRYIRETIFSPLHGKFHIESTNPVYEDVFFDEVEFPLRLYRDVRREGDDILPHVHGVIEFICVTSGEVLSFIQRYSYLLRRGCIALIASNMVHANTGENAEYYVMQIDPEFLKKFGVDIAEHLPKEADHIVIDPDFEPVYAAEMGELFEEIFEDAEKEDPEASVELMSVLFRLFSKIISYTKERENH